MRLTACPVCSGAVGASFSFGAVDLTRCASCTVVHAVDCADPASVYVDGYHSGEHGFHLDADREPFASYVRQVDARRAALVPPGSVLDVGCGRGRFLEALGRGSGLEPVPATAELARSRGLDVMTGTLEVATGSHDVVTAFHVLEHVPDVAVALRQLVALVRPGGTLLVEVPNWRSLHRREAGDAWSMLSPGEHVTYFSPAVLRRALLDAGLQDVVVRAPSWVGPPQDLAQATRDLGLRRWARALGPLCVRDGQALRPRRTGWTVLRGLEALESRAGVGATLLATARTSSDPQGT